MINLTVVIDNDEALKKLKELQKVAKQSTSSVVSDAERMDDAFNSVKGTIGDLAAAAALGGFVNKIIQVRGEVQQLEVAFETMLGSKAKADALMADVINLAAKTPFGLQDVSNATKMLLAYGSTAESVADEIKMLGNIASGLSIPLNDMIYLYGTTRTQGRMFTQDLRQFMGRGIPLAEELAKQFGVTKDEVGALVTAGEVGFPEMQKALQSMTNEGGQFFNLMEKQSQTITGQISNLEDSIYQMFNAIGESQQETISKGISLASMLVENYEKVIGVISHLVIVYGSYKAAVMTVAAVQTVASTLKMVKAMYDLAKGAQAASAAFSLLKGSTKGWVGLITGVVSAIGILMMDFGQKAEKATETMGELEQAAHDEYIEVNKLVYQLKQASTSEEERASILEKLNRIAPSIVEGINDESTAFENLTSKLEDYNKEQVKRIQLASLADRQNQAVNDYASADLAYKEYTKAVEARMAKLVAEYTSSGTLPDVKFNYNRENALPYAMREGYEEEIRNRIKEALEKASLGELNGVKLAEKLYDIAGGSGTDIVGYDEDFIGSKLSKLYWDREKKKKQLDSTTKNVEEMQSLLGVEGQDNTEDEQSDLNDTKQYLEAKQAAYKAWVTELQKLQAIERGEVEATEEAWKTQKQNEENARKAYEALGGVTKDTSKSKLEDDLKWVDDFVAEADKDAATATEKLEAEIAKREKTWDEYLIQFGTFRERWAATERKYDREISEAETEGERKALEAERDAALAAFEVQANAWAKDLVNKSQEEINKLLEELQSQVDAKEAAFDALDSSDSQEAKDYKKTINELNAQIAHLKTLVKDTGEETQNGNWDESVRVFQEIIATSKEAASSLEKVDESFGKMATGLIDLASFSLNAVTAIKKVGEAAKGIEKASAILTVISLAVQFVSGIMSGIIATNKEYKETINNFKALNKELEQMNRLAKISSLEGTIFGEDAFGNFVNNLNVMRNATQDFAKSQEAIINRGKEIVNAVTGFEEYGTIIENFSWGNIAESLKNMQVLVKDRGKFAESWGAKDKYANLGDMLPELFGDEGVTLEGLQNLQQSDVWDKLSKENRDLIEQMIADWELYNKSTEAVSNYLKDIFGDFGATMTDILVDSFTQGTDAAIAFGDAMSDIVERLTKDFIYSAFIKDFVDEAQAKVDALNNEELSSEERVRRLVDILKQLSNDVLGAQDEVNNTLAMLDAEGYGIDGVAGQSSSAGGFQAMSQETGSELNGRFTDIQGKVTGINEAVQYIKSLSFSQLQQTTSISETVAQIHNDTSLIEKHTRVLSAIYVKLDKIESNTRES